MSLRRAMPAIVAAATSCLMAHPVASTDAPAKSQPSWTSPLAPNAMAAYRANRQGIRPSIDLRETSARRVDPNPATHWITEAALLALSTTGRISGSGRDTTADIGKPPLGMRTDPFAQGIQGGIR